MKLRTILLLLTGSVLVLLSAASPAQAHRIRIWATVMDSGTIRGEVFSPGARLSGLTVRVYDSQGQLIAELTTDDNGQFAYRPTAKHDHLFKVDLGDGHASEILVSPSKSGAEQPADVPQSADVTQTAPPEQESGSSTGKGESPAKSIAEYELEIFQLRRQIAAEGEQIRPRDLIGGVGYIFGAAGVAALVMQRRRRARTGSGNSAGD